MIHVSIHEDHGGGRLRATLVIAACLALMAPTLRAAEATELLRAELEKGLAAGMPSISAAIATRQGVIWSAAFGYADLASHSRAHPGYLYGIGSITKVFVACVIEQLIDEGRLRLDSTGLDVLGADAVAGIPNADRATVRQLLDHTSGVPSWEFDPEKVTHHDAVLEIHDRILAPLGLNDIRFEGFEPLETLRLPSRYHFGTADFVRDAGMHASFTRIDSRLIDVSRSNLSTEWTAGAMVATARDLALFFRALRDGRVVGTAALQRMESFRSTDDKDEDMGQGLALDRYGRERLIGYSGNVLGFGAAAGWIPGEDVVLVVMTNVGAMHAGDSAYYPEKLLKNTRVIAAARAVSRELAAKWPAP